MFKSYRGILLLGVATALAAIATSCAGGGAPSTPTKAAATPTTAAAPTAAVVTPAAGATTPAGAVTAAATPAAGAPGDANVGKQLIVSKGCPSCHVVPGVPEAKGTIGPSLAGFGSRTQIAGVVPNTPENQAKWLKNPSAVKPGTQMPSLGLSDQEVANLSAFLSTLK